LEQKVEKLRKQLAKSKEKCKQAKANLVTIQGTLNQAQIDIVRLQTELNFIKK
jgi:multidrug resistance efflux pump